MPFWSRRPSRPLRALLLLLLLILVAGGLWAAGRTAGLYASEPPAPVHRMPDALPAPGTGPFRIVALGTSLTARGDWPDSLGARLSACAGRPVTVERVARAGAGSNWGRDQVAAVLALSPDLVLIEFAINDADLRDGVSLARARDNHLALIAALEAGRPGLPLMLMTMNRAEGLRGLMRPRLAAHHAQYRDLAAGQGPGQGVGLIDLAPLWAAALAAGRGPELLPDGLHPTDAAVAEIALPAMVAEIGRLLPGCS